jgi:proliferating cell nuclear antigen
MNIVIKNQQKAECFSTIFQHIRLFTEHINITFEKERLYIQSMDTARVSIFELYLTNTWFDVYEHTNASAITIGVNSTLLFKILNTREKTQETTIKFDSENSDKLYINFTSENKAIFDKNFEFPLMDLEHDIMGIPDTDYNAEFSLCSTNFANLINQLKLFGDTLDIHCSEEKILLISTTQDSGKMMVQIDINDLNEFSINEGETIELSFSISMLHNICMYSKISKNINVYIKDNFPMKITYNLGEENANMVFYLAPKIKDDE